MFCFLHFIIYVLLLLVKEFEMICHSMTNTADPAYSMRSWVLKDWERELLKLTHGGTSSACCLGLSVSGVCSSWFCKMILMLSKFRATKATHRYDAQAICWQEMLRERWTVWQRVCAFTWCLTPPPPNLWQECSWNPYKCQIKNFESKSLKEASVLPLFRVQWIMESLSGSKYSILH